MLGERKKLIEHLATAPLLIIDDLGMRKLPATAGEDLLELVMRRYERASTLLTSNRPVDDWGKLLGDTAAVTALLDRLLHHAHVLVEEIAAAALVGTRKEHMTDLATVPLLIIDDLGMRKLPATAAEDLLELIMRRYERVSTLLTSNRPVDDWGKLLGDTAAVTALLDRLLHHAHILKCGPRSWRTKTGTDLRAEGSAA